MALPTLRSRERHGQMLRQREQAERCRHQWELNSQYFKDQTVLSNKQAQWSSRHSYQQSMTAFHRERQKEEKKRSLEERRGRLRTLLHEEREQLEAELRAVVPSGSALTKRLVEKSEELRSAREERRKKLAQELLKEHWKKNNPQLREVESALHKDHVVSEWEVQQAKKKQSEEEAQQEKRRFENEYERTRQEALERMRQAEEKRKAEERLRGEELRKQMEEIRVKEEEARRLKKEQEALLSQRWEVEKLEEERRAVEERRKKSQMGRFLIRQYRAQLKRRAQQVQEELEADRKILAALMEGEEEGRRLESARRERAVADVAWMKRVIEEQLQLEREREAEFDVLYREEAQRVWEKREADWEKERRARERLMQEVLSGRQQQLELKIKENRRAQEESLRRREELLQELELDRLSRRMEREAEQSRRTERMQDIGAQVEERRRHQWEEQRRREEEEEEERKAQRLKEGALQLETQRMVQQGYQNKTHSRPVSAWT